MMPASNGLFSRAGLVSGSFSNWNSHSAEAAEANYRRLLAGANCTARARRRLGAAAPRGGELECLLRFAEAQPAALSDFARWAWTGEAPCRDGCAFAPQVDGVELADWPMALARKAARGGARPSFGRVPLLHGSTLDDGYGFVKSDNFYNLTNSASSDACERYRAAAWGDAAGFSASALRALYPASSYNTGVPADSGCFVASERAETDFAYACPARSASRYAALAGGAVYRYVFALRTKEQTSGSTADAEFVPHGHDLPFLWHHLRDPSLASDDSKALARAMLGFWTRFAAFGDPNGDAASARGAGRSWPRNVPQQADALLRLDAQPRVQRGWHAAQCAYWDAQWEALGRCKLVA